ncbi:AbrB family transcriptional regulator [Peribacillus sp. NPDC046944]|uniref:AbrB family transcriptional regulator n=1 Tax=unclassified Peribacillus TaxID=2675266 RepID=UPI003D06E1E0
MERLVDTMKGIWLVILCGLGGAFLASTGLSIGWMIGSLLMSALLSFWKPAFLKLPDSQSNSMQIWLRTGQCLLGIELGLQLNLSVLRIFMENSITIIIVLALSLLFSLGSGFLLYKLCKMDMLTSFFSTAPGGLSAMPGMAQEAGANTGVVTIIQTIRIFLVVMIVPFFVLGANPLASTPARFFGGVESFNEVEIGWTLVLALAAWGGFHVGKILKLPAPWLVGSMLTVAFFQASGSLIAGMDLIAWWPDSIMIVSQIMIGASVGAKFNRGMFVGMKKILVVSSLSTVAFIFMMILCAYIDSRMTGMSFLTTSLAFAPGGVAEMTATSVALESDPMFVVAVQVLRVLMVYVTLPPLFKLLNQRAMQKNGHPDLSA